MIPSTDSAFVTYNFEPLELSAAYTYSDLQLAGIQNQIASAAEEVLKIPLDVDDSEVVHAKRRAYMQGQIDALKHLLSMHRAFNSAQ